MSSIEPATNSNVNMADMRLNAHSHSGQKGANSPNKYRKFQREQ